MLETVIDFINLLVSQRLIIHIIHTTVLHRLLLSCRVTLSMFVLFRPLDSARATLLLGFDSLDASYLPLEGEAACQEAHDQAAARKNGRRVEPTATDSRQWDKRSSAL